MTHPLSKISGNATGIVYKVCVCCIRAEKDTITTLTKSVLKITTNVTFFAFYKTKKPDTIVVMDSN